MLTAAILFAGMASTGQAQVVVGGGADYATGTYGTGQRIETATASATARATRKRVSAAVSVPHLRVTGPGNAVPAGGPFGLPIFVDPTRPPTRVTRSGMGDVTTGLAYRIPTEKAGLVTTVTASAKLPTASVRRGLGTGKADYTAGVELARPGRVTPFGSVAHTVVGQPDRYRLRDVTAAKAGLALRLSPGAEASLSYHYATPLARDIAGRQEVGAAVNATVAQRLSLGLAGSAGLSKGAPDLGAGVQLGLRL